MRLVASSLLVALALAGPRATAPSQGRPGPAGSFGEDPAWDDGKAELCVYDAEEIVEGEKRRFEATSIVVAELFDPTTMVKKDDFELSFVPVLKCNWFLSVPTGVYRYQQMASLFLRRSDLLAMKVAFSSQEWCGTTFAEWRRDQPGFHVHSYFDGEGDQTHPLEHLAENELFFEQVPLWVRGHRPADPRTEKIRVLGKRIATSKCPPPTLQTGTIAFDGVKEDGGAKRIEVRLTLEGRTDLMVLAPEFPYTMTEWRRADGTTWKLKKTTRLDYWNYSKNEFANLLTK